MNNIKNIKNSEYFNLQRNTNYKIHINNTIDEIVEAYNKVITNYIKLITEQITYKNRQHFIYNFSKGLEIINHVFKLLFYYTKNIELTYYHSSKAYIFYVEFIEQLSNDSMTYLQLTNRDAINFVFKRTIFEINKKEVDKYLNEITTNDCYILAMFNHYIYLYTTMFKYMITQEDYFNTTSNITTINDIYINLTTYIKNIMLDYTDNQLIENITNNVVHIINNTNNETTITNNAIYIKNTIENLVSNDLIGTNI